MPKTNNPSNTSEAQPQSQQAPQTETQPVSPEETIQAVQDMPADTADTVVAFSGRKGGKNGFEAFIATRTEAVQGKVQLVTEAKKQLALAAEASAKGDEEADKASEPAAKGGLLLYRGLAQGVLSNDEVNDILGSTFGYKQKKNGEDSKTPLGIGEEIRKRVGRAAKAYDYAIAGNEPIAFFEPLEREEVADLVNRIGDGDDNIGLWEFYRQSGELKAERTGKRPKAAFDPRRIAAMTRDWGQNLSETVAIVQRTPGLFSAMAGMLQMLQTIGSELPVPESEAA